MRKREWLGVLVALMACGLIAAGCGSDDSTSSDAASADTTSTTSDTTPGDTSDATTEDSGGDKTADDVYNACVDAIAGTPGEEVGKAGCTAAKNAFEQCETQADAAPEGTAKDTAVKACQDAADAAVAALNSAG